MVQWLCMCGDGHHSPSTTRTTFTVHSGIKLGTAEQFGAPNRFSDTVRYLLCICICSHHVWLRWEDAKYFVCWWLNVKWSPWDVFQDVATSGGRSGTRAVHLYHVSPQIWHTSFWTIGLVWISWITICSDGQWHEEVSSETLVGSRL